MKVGCTSFVAPSNGAWALLPVVDVVLSPLQCIQLSLHGRENDLPLRYFEVVDTEQWQVPAPAHNAENRGKRFIFRGLRLKQLQG